MSLNVAKMQHQAAELDAELAQARFSGRSADGVASVVVTGRGELIDLVLADHVIKSAHPEVIGPAVVEAIGVARRAASAVGAAKIRAVLDKDQEWYPERPPSPGHAQEVPVAAAPPPPRHEADIRPVSDASDEESFEDIDFLDVDEDDEDEGRW